VSVVDWDDPSVDWSSFDRVLPRSTWDYPERLDEFLAWVDRVDGLTDLRNSPALMRWSMDKHYLLDLGAVGVPVTPTVAVEVGQAPVFPEGPFVVKPAIGAGSRDAASYQPDQCELAESHIARLHARGASVLVQPLLASVAEHGEWPLVFFNGEFSHAASKRVALASANSVDPVNGVGANSPYVATSEQVEVGATVVAEVTARFGVPLYARVDLVRDDDGGYCVLEVEIVEPYLFLPEGGPAAVAAMVQAFTSG
jgi:glutathione synthase/RimK-type ligase-like ATP-grasp enzyme